MKILAYDTSSDFLSLALFNADKKISSLECSSFTRHSSALAPSIKRLLKNSKMNLNQIECLAVGLGPGSFTGLRVGLTTAKVLAYAMNKKIVGVTSLEAIAQGAPSTDRMIVALVDAKKDKFYAGFYKKDGASLKVIQEPFLIDVHRLLSSLKQPAVFVGSGVSKLDGMLGVAKTKSHQLWFDNQYFYPKAAFVAQCALRQINEKKFSDVFSLEPLYLHPRDCNVTLPAKKKAGLRHTEGGQAFFGTKKVK